MENEKKRKKKRKKKREEEIAETALAAAGAALFASGIKKLLPYLFLHLSKWQIAPSPLLFLLIHVLVAAIAIVSLQQPCYCWILARKKKKKKRRPTKDHSMRKRSKKVKQQEKSKSDACCGAVGQRDEEGDTEELNARVEAFITAFRRQLRLDSFASRRFPEGNAGLL